MAKLKDLKVTIGLSKEGLTKLNSDLRSTKSNFKRNFGEIQAMATNMGKNLTMTVTAPLIGMAAVSLNAFDQQRKAIAQVEAGLKSTGAAVGFTSKQLQKMASDLQSKTLFGDEEILKDATAQLLTFTNITGDQFKEAQKSALDLATRLDGDLKGASIMLGKALNDPVANLSAMSRAGIQFSEDQKEVIKALAESGNMAEAQSMILKELEKQYGGSAEAAAQAGMGPFKQLQNTLGDVSEEFGELLNEMIKPLIPKIQALADRFANLSDRQKKLLLVLGGIAGMVGPVLLLVGALISAAGAMASLNLAMLANPVVAVTAGIIALGAALYAYGQDTVTAKEETDEFIKSLDNLDRQQKLNAITARKLALEQQLLSATTAMAKYEAERETLIAGMGDTARELEQDLFQGFKDKLTDMQEAMRMLNEEEMEIRFGEGLIVTADTDATAAKNRKKKRDAEKKAFTEKMNESARLREAEQALNEATFQQIGTTEDLTEAQQGLRDAYGEVGGAIEEIPFDEFEEAIFEEDTQERIKHGTSLLQKAAFAANNIGAAFSLTSQLTEAAFNNIKDKSQGFHLVIKQMLEDLLKKAIALAAAFAAMSIFMGPSAMAKSGIGGFKEFMMGGLGFGNIPQMASGGLFTGASLAMVGEGPGTSLSNPEVVAPLDKLQSMIGGGNVTVTGRLDGRDILISSERANIDRNRIRGF
jgi:hypothetical protein